jgi:integrase
LPLTRKRGRYWYGFVRVNGISSTEASTGCEDRDAAERLLRDWERDAADPHGAAKRRTTLDDALSTMLKRCRELRDAHPPKLASATVEHYEKKAAVVKTVFSALEPPVTMLAQVDHPTLAGYISARRAMAISEHTISKELTVIRMIVQLARARHEYALHWDDLLPGGWTSGYTPDLTFLRPAGLNLLFGELLPDHAARAAWMVATSGEWSASTRARRDDVVGDEVHVRGSKRATRDRRVPLVMAWQRELVAYALDHGQGKDDLLFEATETAFRQALYGACEALEARRRAIVAVVAFLAGKSNGATGESFPCVSANDLRRTFGMWMRAAGVAVSEIALMMGHRDSKMAERVYARIPADLLADLLKSPARQPAAGSVPAIPANKAAMARGVGSKSLELVPRGGIEPPTRGFSVPGGAWITPRYDRETRRRRRSSASLLPIVAGA